MKSRTVIILWIIALALGITTSVVKFGSNDENTTHTKLSPGQKLLEDLPIREITSVTLTQGKKTTHLKKDSTQGWSVTERNNYPINYANLRNLLGSLAELEVTQGYPTGSEHLGRFGLAEESEKKSEQALRVTMTNKDGNTVADVFLGKFSGTSHVGGRFIRIASDNSGVYAVSETFPGITATAKDWLNQDFLKIDQIKTISLSAPADPEFKPWKLIRHPKTDGSPNPNGQLTLDGMTNKEVMQLTSTNPLRNLFSYSGFQDVLSKKQAANTANPNPKLKRRATITTYDGLTYTLDFRPQKNKPKNPDADDRLPPVQPSYLLTITVTADIPEKRTPVANETPEETKARDTAFATQQKSLKEKLTAAQALTGHIYQISQSTISPLQKKRSDFVKSKTNSSALTPPVREPATPPTDLPTQ